jgi:ligand-binding sensor domain-containing protein
MVDIARTTSRACRATQTGRLAVVPPRDDGYIWIATQNGLLRFDGISGKQAQNQQSHYVDVQGHYQLCGSSF